MKKATLGQRLRYAFDRSLSGGTVSLIGYRLERHAGDAARAYGVRVNPPKREAVTFQPEDRIVVLAED